MRRILLLAVITIVAFSPPGIACTNLLVTPAASSDGSAYVTYSCDNGGVGAIRVVQGQLYSPGSTLSIHRTDLSPDAGTTESRPMLLGQIPQAESTYRCFEVLGLHGDGNLGGMNQRGVCIAETTLSGTRLELANAQGILSLFSTWPGQGVVTIALQRASTAREAIVVIGDLFEEYGLRANGVWDGEHLAISDGTETWSMEILGPGPDWNPGSEKPGALWCAQRIPDGHVGVSANRSRIGEVDLSDPETFMASSNVHSLAQEMGWWDQDSGEPFVWYEAYAPLERPSAIMREWRALSLVAPSLGLTPDQGRFPFSVAAERLLANTDVMAIQRDMLEGTVFDVTEAPGFDLDGARSPLACPLCAPSFYELVDADWHVTISNRHASFSCVYQVSTDAPEEMRGCAWFGYGPAATTCYVPIYSGVTELPDVWGKSSIGQTDASIPFWSMTLASQLATAQWQDAYRDIRAVRDPAEQTFLDEQACLPSKLAEVSAEGDACTAFLNEYTQERLEAVRAAYERLVDYLLITYYSPLGPFAPRELPEVGFEALPDCETHLMEDGTRAPICIEGDAGFSLATSWTIGGTGTAGDPYIIGGWIIEGGCACIRVKNTTKHLVIRDCQLNGGGNGVLLVNARNVLIENCVVRNANSDCSQWGDAYGSCGDGICLYQSSGIIVRGCRVEASSASGISLYGSSACLIQGNRLIGNGASGIEISRASFRCEAEGNFLEGNGWSYGSAALEIAAGSHDNTALGNEFLSNRGDNLQVSEDHNSTEGNLELQLVPVDVERIDWLASINEDNNPNPIDNYATMAQGSDSHGGYYAMEWNSPKYVDLSLNGLWRFDWGGARAFALTLAADAPMEVRVWITVSGNYCGRDWQSLELEDVLHVGTTPATFTLPRSLLVGGIPRSGCDEPPAADATENISSAVLLPSNDAGELRVYGIEILTGAPGDS